MEWSFATSFKEGRWTWKEQYSKFFKLAKKNLRKDGSEQKNILTNQDEIKPIPE